MKLTKATGVYSRMFMKRVKKVKNSRTQGCYYGNGEREAGNECTAVIPVRIQNRLFNAT